MSLTANPPCNCTSARNPRSGSSATKSFQNFSQINPTQGTTFLQSQPANYIINNATNSAFITNLLANVGLSNFGYTAFVVTLGNHNIWATRAPVPASGLCSGTTWFCDIFWDLNELVSSGDMAFP